jgi:hypothetical protein
MSLRNLMGDLERALAIIHGGQARPAAHVRAALGTKDFDSRAATNPYGADPGTNDAAGQDASQRPSLRVKIHAAPGVALFVKLHRCLAEPDRLRQRINASTFVQLSKLLHPRISGHLVPSFLPD